MRESDKLFIWSFSRLDLSHVIMLWRVPFYNEFLVTDNSILSGLFWSYLHDYYNIDNSLTSVFKTAFAGKRGIYDLVEQ